MSEEPQAPDPCPRKALIVWWDPAEMTVEVDAPDMSWFDVKGLCEAVLDVVEMFLPNPMHQESE